MKRYRIQLAIAFIVLACGASLIGALYRVLNSPEKAITSSVVVMPSSPVASPAQTTIPRMNWVSHPLNHPTPYVMPMTDYHRAPVAAMPSIGGLYTTSSARVHSVGGGGNGGYGIATTSHSSSSRGINSNGQAAMPTTNFVAMASQRQVAQPEAQEAPQMAKLASSPRRAPGPPNIDGPLPEDHQLVEHPIGDALWPLLLMAIGYAVYRYTKKRKTRVTASLS